MQYNETIAARLTGRHKMAFRITGELKDKRVLNIGCHIGCFEEFAMEQGGALVVGIDIKDEFLRKVQELVSQATFIHASALDLPFENNFFDVVTMFEVG